MLVSIFMGCCSGISFWFQKCNAVYYFFIAVVILVLQWMICWWGFYLKCHRRSGCRTRFIFSGFFFKIMIYFFFIILYYYLFSQIWTIRYIRKKEKIKSLSRAPTGRVCDVTSCQKRMCLAADLKQWALLTIFFTEKDYADEFKLLVV